MPSSTPTFGIRYPCAGDTIDPAVFVNFATDVEAALTSVATSADAALTRYAVSVRTATAGSAVAPGVPTALTIASTDFNDGFTVGATTVTVTNAGVYLVNAEFSPQNTVTTVTEFDGSIAYNGVNRYTRKLGKSGANNTAWPMNVSGLVVCAAASTLSMVWIWNSVGAMNVYGQLTASFVCNP